MAQRTMQEGASTYLEDMLNLLARDIRGEVALPRHFWVSLNRRHDDGGSVFWLWCAVNSQDRRYPISTRSPYGVEGDGDRANKRERQSREVWWRVQRFYNIIVQRGGGGGPLVDEADERPSGVRRWQSRVVW
jgi:hypothetical protein